MRSRPRSALERAFATCRVPGRPIAVGARSPGEGAPVRVLALDHGQARCGCALSDPTGTLVTPLDPIERPDTRRGLAAIAAIVAEREVERVVVGLPLSLRGEDTDQTRAARAFAAALARRLGERVPVELHDERFTTRIAARTGGLASEDSRAAAVLLEDWLGRRA